MVAPLLIALGGLGLFSMGMSAMTQGLESLAGGGLSRFLTRSTKSPWSGAITGLVTTALVQSSSATTVMAVGFAGSGMLSFPQALGIIFGANLGTTVTGWLVALLGFQLDLTHIAPLLVFVGMGLRLLPGARRRSFGSAIAGFGLLFTGLGMLQDGVRGIDLWPGPESLPGAGPLGRLAWIGIGIGVTVITQSSSAGVATAIAAVHAGQIDLSQAGAVVIGMDVGTTITALAASLGGSLEARRTGMAHVIFNLFTAAAAFLALPAYLALLQGVWPDTVASSPELALVGFHSAFNLFGVLVGVPLAHPFARLIERLLPGRASGLALDRGLLRSPHAAIESSTAALRQLAARSARQLARQVRSRSAHSTPSSSDLRAELGSLRRFLLELETDREHGLLHRRHVWLLEAIDHLDRALRRAEPRVRMASLAGDLPESKRLRSDVRRTSRMLDGLADGLEQGLPDPASGPRELCQELRIQEPQFRAAVLRRSVEDQLADDLALSMMDEARRLRRLSYHAWQVAARLTPNLGNAAKA